MKPPGNPGIETLRSDPAYRLVQELDFKDMIPFVLAQIRKKGIMSRIYLGINLAMTGIIIGSIIVGIVDQSLTWRGIIGQSLTGIVCGSLLVIPFHELLHGVAYRILGAKSIRFGVDFRQFIFFVTADRYPVSGKQICFLALVPIAVINIVTILITVFIMPRLTLFSGFLLLSHNIMCIGDFAIANFVNHAKGRLYSFDEPEKKKSFFFEEVAPEQ